MVFRKRRVLLIKVQNMQFTYPRRGFALYVKDFTLQQGENCVLTGGSGSGKSTFSRLLSGELTTQNGLLSVMNHEFKHWGERKRRDFRLRKIGLVFQEALLLDYLTLEENILFPSKQMRRPPGDDLQSCIDRCGLRPILKHYPQELSAGERQRAAICRALAHSPRLIIADEPTSNLDPLLSKEITQLLIDSCKSHGSSLFMVTHDHSLLPFFDRQLDINDLNTTRIAPC
jgi:putative ABC transport system ATP-binding protein